jgi:uncharacterized protein YciW
VEVEGEVAGAAGETRVEAMYSARASGLASTSSSPHSSQRSPLEIRLAQIWQWIRGIQ